MGLKIGKFLGAPIILSGGWFIFVFAITILNYFKYGISNMVETMLAIMVLSLSVLLHEMGHSLMAKYFNAKTDSITLYFFGGLAKINESGWIKLIANPVHSLFVWLAGPLVNIVIFAVFFSLLHCFQWDAATNKNLSFVAVSNIGLAVFNLLPVFPMDGGGILYSLLRMFTTKARAIKITSIVGIIGSICFILLAIKLKAVMLGFVGIVTLLASIRAPRNQYYM